MQIAYHTLVHLYIFQITMDPGLHVKMSQEHARQVEFIFTKNLFRSMTESNSFLKYCTCTVLKYNVKIRYSSLCAVKFTFVLYISISMFTHSQMLGRINLLYGYTHKKN